MTCLASSLCLLTVVASVAFAQPERDRDLEELGAKKLVDAGLNASWSPDGSLLAYGKPMGQGICILDLQSGKVTELTDRGKDATWSPDGRFIAYVTEPRFNEYRHEMIWLVSPEGGEPQRLTGGTYPSWIDAANVFYYSQSQRKLLSMSIDNRKGKIILDATPSWYCALSSDGRLVAYATRGHFKVRAVESGKTVGSWSIGAERGALPSWSPDGKLVSFGGYDGSRLGLWVYDLKTGSATPVAMGCYTRPIWSSDGKKLAFDFRPQQQTIREIWMIETETLEGRQAHASLKDYRLSRKPK